MSDNHDAVFVDGVHYRIGDDGHADLSQPLRRNETNDGWRPADDGDPLHNDTFFASELEMVPGSEG